MARDERKVVISGATGGLGSTVIEALLRLAPAAELGVSVREPGKAGDLAARGVRVRHGDFDRPETLDAAFEGAERVLIISTRAPANSARLAQACNAIEAALRCGVRHIFYTSIVQRPGSRFAAAQGHFDTEAYLEACGARHTILRNGHYMENLPMVLGPSIAGGDLALPPDGPTAWVSRLDLAEGIAKLLLAAGKLPESVLLTGPEALDFSDIAPGSRARRPAVRSRGGSSRATPMWRFSSSGEFPRGERGSWRPALPPARPESSPSSIRRSRRCSAALCASSTRSCPVCWRRRARWRRSRREDEPVAGGSKLI